MTLVLLLKEIIDLDLSSCCLAVQRHIEKSPVCAVWNLSRCNPVSATDFLL